MPEGHDSLLQIVDHAEN